MNININQLDVYEQRLLAFLMKNGASVESNIRVMINNVEGDESQMSDELKRLKEYFKIEY